MANGQREKIEYEFDDLRRNTDPIPDNVLDQLGLDEEDLTENERHEDEQTTDGEADTDDTDSEADDELAEDGEYDPAKMTKAMRKRLAGVKRDANRQLAAAKAEAGETISKLEKRIATLEKTGKTDELNEFSGKLEDLESQIEAAMEKGDSKTVASLTRQMGELTADLRDRKRELEAEHDEPDDLGEEDTPTIIPRAMEWIQEQDWWDDEDLGHVRAFVRKADLALQKKGYKPTDDDFYEHLEALVEKKYPGIVEHTVDLGLGEEDEEEEFEEEDEFGEVPSKSRRKAKAKKQRRRSPVSEGDRGGVSRTKKKFRKKKGKTLSRARVANMKAFGLDPDDPKAVENYLEGCDDE